MTLSEIEGKPEARPTRENIVREFEQLIRKVSEGDQVVILMAGHGSQQPVPDPNDPNNPEIDGLDEIFLPADVAQWDSDRKTVPGAIRDNEIGAWLTSLTGKKAYVWAIFDCCHSGNMTRSLKDRPETPRGIPAGLLVPQTAFDAARKQAAAQRPPVAAGDGVAGARPKPPTVPGDNSGYLVALSACRAYETTPECAQPVEDRDAKTYGLLTYTTVGELGRAAAAGRRLSYRELLHRIQSRYLGRLGISPTPELEAADQDRAVLAADSVARSGISVRQVEGKYRADRGDMHGVTVGSVLAVYDGDKSGDANNPVGYVRIVESLPFDSVVEPCAYSGEEAVRELPATAYAKIVFLDYSLRGLRVAVVAAAVRAAEVARVKQMAGEIEKSRKGLLNLVPDPRQADVVIRLDENGQHLDLKTVDDVKHPISLKPNDPRFGSLLAENLEKVVRARNFVEAASRYETNGVAGFEPAVKVETEIVILRKGVGPVEIVKQPATNLVLRDSDKVQLRVVNTSEATRVDVSILIVGADFQITSFFPLRGGQVPKALGPGESVTTAPATVRAPFGLEKVIVIAMAGAKPPVDFTLLAQAGLKERGYVSQTPLAQLLENAVYRNGGSRGATPDASKMHTMKVIAWNCQPAAAPAK
ncbi:hypothetical protein FRUB_05303 [Fimbriiglobus ruber]|uniref:Peptidase C14 caspase domain-containing protein n=1 Tax=Fimbriiglobus ruber TaxID=1908690 RepID=A0A225DL45_9BACT|nr:hypothetical protein FRUB_05303 [Fimbriiglobus ruber]